MDKFDLTVALNLITDMKKELLPKKFSTATQSRLLNFKQNELTIGEYGYVIIAVVNNRDRTVPKYSVTVEWAEVNNNKTM
ncbi:unnamed protein product [Parnassius apollo]|uniref:(apollo) hypothetical protein n=1 Tax=Parnassius apollo TaxID=110799 RepID=A0A8S3Y525_PARAO|nr:unnamed protein product [Parnassius apollo]